MPTLDILPVHETPGSFFQIDIPEDLASVEEVYEAPASLDPKVILHIQNVHGNYQAQTQVKKMLDYFYKNYGFKLIFCEGAAEKMDSKYLELFPDKKDNLALADDLAKKGQLTGPELYLMDAPKDVQAIGIEQTDLYRGNYDAFRKVYKLKKSTDSFLKLLDSRLELLSSRFLTRDMRRILSEWQKFHEGRREFMPFVKHLAEESQKFLNLDLNSLFAQVEWPQTARLLVLQSMEADLKQDEAMAERDQLLAFLKEHKASETLMTGLQKMEEKTISLQRLAMGKGEDPFQPRKLLERLAEEAAPMGFQFHQYPNFSLYAGYTILESEMDSKVLFQEIEKLFDRMLESLTVSEKEKNLLELYKDLELLKKLVALELTRTEWDQATYRKNWIKPQSLVERLDKMSASGFVTENLVVNKEIPTVFDAAFSFYDFARQREFAFYDTIEREMTAQKADRAILVTGGFHTDGLSDIFRAKNINYGILTPRMGGDFDKTNYIKTLMETQPTIFDLAQMEMANTLQSMISLIRLGVDPKHAVEIRISDYVTSFNKIVKASGLHANDTKALATFIDFLNERTEFHEKGVGFQPLPSDDGRNRYWYRTIKAVENGKVILGPLTNAEGKPFLFLLNPNFESSQAIVIDSIDRSLLEKLHIVTDDIGQREPIEKFFEAPAGFRASSPHETTLLVNSKVRLTSGSALTNTPSGERLSSLFIPDLNRGDVLNDSLGLEDPLRTIQARTLGDDLSLLDSLTGSSQIKLAVSLLSRSVRNVEEFSRLVDQLQSNSSENKGDSLMAVAEMVSQRSKYTNSNVLAAFKSIFEASSDPGAITADLTESHTEAEYADLAAKLKVLFANHKKQIIQLLISRDVPSDEISAMKTGVFSDVVAEAGHRFLFGSEEGFNVAEFSRMLMSLLVKMHAIKPASLSVLLTRYFVAAHDGDYADMAEERKPYHSKLIAGTDPSLGSRLTAAEKWGTVILRIALAAKLSRMNGAPLDQDLATYLAVLDDNSYMLSKNALLLVQFMNDVFSEQAIKASA
ncbi:MAG: hypothetical protein KBC91_04770 [Candidatus Omnitrophica bacterium]|nr:hypothetical protein [Candidatus Omnitrophota bacterium]